MYLTAKSNLAHASRHLPNLADIKAEGTPLHTGFTFFYMRRGKASKSFKQDTSNASSLADKDGEENSDKQNQQPSYFDAVKQIGTCHTVEEFWAIYNHLVRPADLPSITDYHCFREGMCHDIA